MKALKSRRLWGLLLLTLGFLPLLYLTGGHLFDFADALVVAVGIGVVAAYLPGIARSFRESTWNGEHYLVLGIVLVWGATAVRHGWQWAWRYFGRPMAMMDTPWLGFIVYLAFMGGVLHLFAKGAIRGGIPRQNWVRIGVIIAMGLAMAYLVVALLEPQLGV